MGAMFQLTASTVSPAPGTKILKAGDYSVLLEANALLEAARARAARIEQEAQKAYEERREEGYRDGQEAGKLELAEKVMETVLSSVEFIEGIEDTLVSVVNMAVRKIVGEIDDGERIVRIVRTALNTVRGQQKVTVRVCPADEEAVSQALAAMTAGSSETAFLTVVADARMEKNACLLESELGVVDASLETQLKAFENAFHRKIRQ
ncbi:HrpE/YscL family type III secretion apparatus protein [uncultured Mailhella sp.]|uniref:HrpE/YscL family type III secretion apparatus protein n=1 Tax=uncultured Mailhella sp. TaxID=1981031 RepID=UPI00262D7EC0|nr:HrpE/YscL family type III secretion apparatus protein [uncultured Mailhella sp.]